MIIGAVILIAITLSSGGFAKLVGSRFASQRVKAFS
jgi:simple sugar transport system permease protein